MYKIDGVFTAVRKPPRPVEMELVEEVLAGHISATNVGGLGLVVAEPREHH